MIQFNHDICNNLQTALQREWLETNGLGGFASSTIIGLNTRRYHGLLTAATQPLVGRFVLLSKLEETLTVDGQRFELSANQYPGVVHPQGYQFLKEFRLDPFPVFVDALKGIEIEKSVFMVHGENSVVVQYEFRSAHSSVPLDALKRHYPEYLMEAAGLGLFMVSACVFGVILEHPSSPVHQAISNPLLRRMLMGIAMGTTAISIIYSPWGKQSGAHLNPSVTLTFFRLGKVAKWDALFYAVAQFVGGVAGVLLVRMVLESFVSDPHVNYIATLPGEYGAGVAFLAEVVITFILMSVVLKVSNTPIVARYTGLCAGALVATYITVEAPLSGMSMNPARTFGSAFSAIEWTALWVYFTAPPLGMLLAAHVYLQLKGAHCVSCAKLHHQNEKRCIFCGKEQGVME
jgi:aquaporin Z